MVPTTLAASAAFTDIDKIIAAIQLRALKDWYEFGMAASAAARRLAGGTRATSPATAANDFDVEIGRPLQPDEVRAGFPGLASVRRHRFDLHFRVGAYAGRRS